MHSCVVCGGVCMHTHVYVHLSLQRPEDNVRSSVASSLTHSLEAGFLTDLGACSFGCAEGQQSPASCLRASLQHWGHRCTCSYPRLYPLLGSPDSGPYLCTENTTHGDTFLVLYAFLNSLWCFIHFKTGRFFSPISLIRYSSCQRNNLRSMRCTGFVCNLWINLELCRP